MTNNNITSPEPMISPEALAHLGGGRIAYVRTIRAEDLRQAPCSMPCTRRMARRSC